MDFGQILKRSWKIIKENKFLWWLGILAGGSSVSFPSFQGSSSGGSGSGGADFSWAEATALLTSPIFWIVVVFILIIFVLFLYLCTSARAGLFIAVNKHEETGEKIGFKKSLKEGSQYFWKLFGAGLLSFAIILVPLIILCGIPLLLFFFVKESVVFVIIVILGALVILAICFYLGLLMQLIQRLIVLDNCGVVQSFKTAHNIFKRNWKNYLISVAISWGISMLVSLLVVMSVIIVVIFGIVFGILSHKIGGEAAAISFAIIIGCCLFIALMVLFGPVNAFMSTFWTLVYRALKYVDQITINPVKNDGTNQ